MNQWLSKALIFVLPHSLESSETCTSLYCEGLLVIPCFSKALLMTEPVLSDSFSWGGVGGGSGWLHW